MFFDNLRNGWNYFWRVNPPQRDDTAQRSGFLQFQTFPRNRVEGGGVLVQEPFHNMGQVQVMQNQIPVVSDARGGGQVSGSITSQALVNTSSAMG